VVSFTLWPLYLQGKSPWYPLNRRLGGSQRRWSGRGGEKKNFQPLPGLEPSIIQQVAQCYTTELSRLLKLQETGENFILRRFIICTLNLMVKVKVNFPLCLTKLHAMKTYWGSGLYSSTHSLISALDGCEWSASRPCRFTPISWYALDRKLGGPQSRSGRGGEEKISQPPPGIDP
jgi:hypothetical protein